MTTVTSFLLVCAKSATFFAEMSALEAGLGLEEIG